MSLVVSLMAIGLLGCSSGKQIEKALNDNPDILFNVIKNNPAKFLEVVNEAARNAQSEMRKKQEDEEKSAMEDEFKAPKQPKIEEGRVVFGPKSAPITIVEYSDFECPYCARGYENLREVRKAYGDKLRVIYKHLPLDFHPMAMPAAKFMEALALQLPDKVEKFHDALFENQNELKTKKEQFLKDTAKKLGADMARLLKDIDSDKVKSRISEDMEEAKNFGFSGTPGFLVNGVSLKGAYPPEAFKPIIDRHLGGGT